MKKRLSIFTILFSVLLTGCSNKCPHINKRLVSDSATCTLSGAKLYYCEDCHETIKENSPALGHDYSILVSDTSTCTESGTKTTKCSRCGDPHHEHIPAKGHDYGYAICHNCGGINPDYEKKTMTSSFSYSNYEYLINTSLQVISSITLSIKFSSGSTSAEVNMYGSSDISCIGAISVVDSDDKSIVSARPGFVKTSSSTLVNVKVNKTLARSINVGEILYIRTDLYKL